MTQTIVGDVDAERFSIDGFLFPFTAISKAQADVAVKQYNSLFERPGLPLDTLRAKAYMVLPWVYEIASCPDVLRVLRGLIGPDIILYSTSFFQKSPQSGAFIPWHHDVAYMDTDRPEGITIWVALTKSTRENGCLRLIPGTHLKHQSTKWIAPDDPKSMLPRCIDTVDETTAVDVVLEPGQFSVHDYRITHGSGPNNSDEMRIGLSIFYLPARVKSRTRGRSGMLVSGHDADNYWKTETPPKAEFEPEAVGLVREQLSGL